MPKLDSVLHNFDNHLRSGLCDLIPSVVEAFESGGRSRFELELLDDAAIDSLNDKLSSVAKKAKNKLIEILAHESSMPIEDLASVHITIDLLADSEMTRQRRTQLTAARVWYGYNPVYDFEMTVLPKVGVPRTMRHTDPGRRINESVK
ncbi:MAG: hypothetical protein AAFU53_09635 [Cyanobacteria bacterium J06632_3]